MLFNKLFIYHKISKKVFKKLRNTGLDQGQKCKNGYYDDFFLTFIITLYCNVIEMDILYMLFSFMRYIVTLR